MMIQFCGLSGSGKTTIAQMAAAALRRKGIAVEVLDGDEYRKSLSADLGFSEADRKTNIRRLAFVAHRFAAQGILPIICAINPYEAVRREVCERYPPVFTVYVQCSMEELRRRDTKGLYARALLPDGHADKLPNLTGVNDVFEAPATPDLLLQTDHTSPEDCCAELVAFLSAHWHTTPAFPSNSFS